MLVQQAVNAKTVDGDAHTNPPNVAESDPRSYPAPPDFFRLREPPGLQISYWALHTFRAWA